LKPDDPDSSPYRRILLVVPQYELSKLANMHHLALGTTILSCLASAYQPGPADELSPPRESNCREIPFRK
jgi:hypothetical protein